MQPEMETVSSENGPLNPWVDLLSGAIVYQIRAAKQLLTMLSLYLFVP